MWVWAPELALTCGFLCWNVAASSCKDFLLLDQHNRQLCALKLSPHYPPGGPKAALVGAQEGPAEPEQTLTSRLYWRWWRLKSLLKMSWRLGFICGWSGVAFWLLAVVVSSSCEDVGGDDSHPEGVEDGWNVFFVFQLMWRQWHQKWHQKTSQTSCWWSVFSFCRFFWLAEGKNLPPWLPLYFSLLLWLICFDCTWCCFFNKDFWKACILLIKVSWLLSPNKVRENQTLPPSGEGIKPFIKILSAI